MSITMLKPTISEIRTLGPLSSRVTIEPLERGFGHTLGNALRRVMMSSIPGFAATEVKIDGIMHEYDRIDGMREDVIWLILNLKNVVFKLSDSDHEVVRLKKEGPCTVTAGDLQLNQNVSVVNPDHVIATLSKGGKLSMEVTVESGMGYQQAVPDKEHAAAGSIQMDASFCPVRRMSFEVGAARHENRVDLDRLTLDIESNGVFSCEEIIRHASRILIDQFQMLAELGGEDFSQIEQVGRRRTAANLPLYSEKVDILELTVRSQNCLRQENIRYIGELVQKDERDMMGFANLGRKSLQEIKVALGKHSLELGTDLPGWKAPR